MGSVWEGTVTIINVPSTAQFNFSVLDISWGTFFGVGPYGPIQVYGQETLTIAGQSLTANTQYQARFIGISQPEELSQPTYPVALSNGGGPGLRQILGNAGATNLNSFTLPTGASSLRVNGIQPSDACIILANTGVAPATPIQITTVTGGQSFIQYRAYEILGSPFGLSAPVQDYIVIPINGTVDNNVFISLSVPGGAGSHLSVYASPIIVPDKVIPSLNSFASCPVAANTFFTTVGTYVRVKSYSGIIFSPAGNGAIIIAGSFPWGGGIIQIGEWQTQPVGNVTANFDHTFQRGIDIVTPFNAVTGPAGASAHTYIEYMPLG
jgi:hypothetical protein